MYCLRAVNNREADHGTRAFSSGAAAKGYASKSAPALEIRQHAMALNRRGTGTGKDRDAGRSWPRVSRRRACRVSCPT